MNPTQAGGALAGLVPDESPVLMRILYGGIAAGAVTAAAELGVADQLGDSGASSTELAAAIGVDAERLRRLLRVLGGLGLVRAMGKDRYELTPEGALLRDEAPGSLRSMFRLYTGPMGSTLFQMAESIRTGAPGFDAVAGAPIFDYMAAHPDEAPSSAGRWSPPAVSRRARPWRPTTSPASTRWSTWAAATAGYRGAMSALARRHWRGEFQLASRSSSCSTGGAAGRCGVFAGAGGVQVQPRRVSSSARSSSGKAIATA
jgi:hypothetical protein